MFGIYFGFVFLRFQKSVVDFVDVAVAVVDFVDDVDVVVDFVDDVDVVVDFVDDVDVVVDFVDDADVVVDFVDDVDVVVDFVDDVDVVVAVDVLLLLYSMHVSCCATAGESVGELLCLYILLSMDAWFRTWICWKGVNNFFFFLNFEKKKL